MQNVNSIDKIPFSIARVMNGNEFLKLENGMNSYTVKITDEIETIVTVKKL